MRNDYSSHDWERRSDDGNYHKTERSNDSDSRERSFRKPYRNSEDSSSNNRRQYSSRFQNNRNSDRQSRPYNSHNREERSYNNDRRPYNNEENRDRSFNRGERSERGERHFGNNRPSRPFNRENRPFDPNRRERRFDRDDRSDSRRSFGQGQRRDHNRDEHPYEHKERVYSSEPRSRYGSDSRENSFKPLRRRTSKFENKKQRRKGPSFTEPNPENKGKIRLNKYISNAGICSRREADVLISTGVITVNDQVVTEMGYKVTPEDVVKYNGTTLKCEKKVYVLLNKPKGYITTSDDPQNRQTVMELVEGACSERLYPVGRLDRNTTGLLLLTNDGELTKKLTHPSFGAQKVYNVELDKTIDKAAMYSLVKGVELEDGMEKVDAINWINSEPLDKTRVGVSIHSGKNRVIRRLFEAIGYEVVKLDRVYFAGLTKKNLLRGKYRFLTEQEVAFLKMNK